MFEFSNFTMFLVTSILVILMPGPAMIFVIKNGLTKGVISSISAAFGTTMGVTFHLLCAAFGLAMIMKTSVIAFEIVKFAGAGYLIYLAVKTLISKDGLVSDLEENNKSRSSIFWQGFLINILNPKLSIFFLAFLPQFIDGKVNSTTIQTIIFGAIFMAMTIVIFIGYGFFASALRNKILKSPRILKIIKGCFASAFLALGVKLAFAER
ncbi:MAG: LysE family translocator [Dehalobacterium sp.]